MRARLIAAAAALLALASSACSRAQSRTHEKRVIVLGIDGMDPAFLERHWNALPNLDRLRRQGDFKRLATVTPPQSPVAWSTFITGMDPDGHGIHDFVHRNPATMAPVSSMAETKPPARTLSLGPWVFPISHAEVDSMRRGTTFWQMLETRGIPATILRMPTNFPPVECESQSLAGMGTPDLQGTFGTFTFFTDDPAEITRAVPGGKIVRVEAGGGEAVLAVEGPANTLRKDRAQTSVPLKVQIDLTEPVARFESGGARFILKQGEWSDWIRAEFPLIPGLKSAAGMFRVYAKSLRPRLGLYVSPVNIDPESPELPLSTPPSYSRTLARSVGPFYTQGIAEDTSALRAGVLDRSEYLAQARLVAREHLALLRYGVEQFRGGVLFFHFLGIDQNSHMLWEKDEPDLLETYRLVDDAIGWVMRREPEALLVVMSDHGFTPFRRAVNLNTWLAEEGFLAGATADEMFARVDWSNTRAYALGLNGVYLNLAGRERNGIVHSGPEAEAVLNDLAARLRALRDPETGEPVVGSVDRAHGPGAPDLVVGYTPGYRCSWQSALGAAPDGIVVPNYDAWIGDHCIAPRFVPGVLIANRKVRVGDPALADLTVTILDQFGIAPGAGMHGRPVF